MRWPGSHDFFGANLLVIQPRLPHRGNAHPSLGLPEFGRQVVYIVVDVDANWIARFRALIRPFPAPPGGVGANALVMSAPGLAWAISVTGTYPTLPTAYVLGFRDTVRAY